MTREEAYKRLVQLIMSTCTHLEACAEFDALNVLSRPVIELGEGEEVAQTQIVEDGGRVHVEWIAKPGDRVIVLRRRV